MQSVSNSAVLVESECRKFAVLWTFRTRQSANYNNNCNNRLEVSIIWKGPVRFVPRVELQALKVLQEKALQSLKILPVETPQVLKFLLPEVLRSK
jgi:hypothetical protein